MIRNTSTERAPWYVVPADHKWFTRVVVAEALIHVLDKLNLSFPKVDAEKRKDLKRARIILKNEKYRSSARIASTAQFCRGAPNTTPPAERASHDRGIDFKMDLHSDVIVIGAGPAGIATAIAANQRGLRTIVFDTRTPPIYKPCGEGLLPQGVASLRSLGIHLNSDIAVPFAGIRFTCGESSAYAKFPDSAGFALRRIRLHQLLVERAIQAGVIFHWGTRVTKLDL